MCVYINQKNRITVPKPAFDPLPLSSPSYRIYVISELVAIYRSYVHGRFCSMVVHAFTTNATHLYLEPIQDERRVLSQYQHIRGYLFRLSGFVLATRQYNVFRIQSLSVPNRLALQLPCHWKTRILSPDRSPTLWGDFLWNDSRQAYWSLCYRLHVSLHAPHMDSHSRSPPAHTHRFLPVIVHLSTFSYPAILDLSAGILPHSIRLFVNKGEATSNKIHETATS